MKFLLKNAIIADGVSTEEYIGDILISGGIIAEIGANIDENAAQILDLPGKYITPGFIDAHSHDDCLSSGEHKIRQGITTEITGNCGLGYFPMKPGIEKYLSAAGLPVDIKTKKTYLKDLLNRFCGFAYEKAPLTRRTALIPHGNIRNASNGDITKMLMLLEQYMQQGAIGLSAGLCYAPGSFADAAELELLCKVAARHNGVFAVHLRDEFDMDGSLDECIGLAEKTGVRLQISHIKAMGAANFGRAGEIIGRIENARARRLMITADCYPYTASMTGFASLATDFALNIERRGGAERIFAGSVNLAELARAEKIPPETLASWFADEGRAALFECMEQSDVDTFITTPWVMVGTDGVLNHPIHPRTYGAFAKYLQVYVNEKKLLSFPEAVRKITSLPASVFGLTDCGRIAKGYRADLVVLDLPRVKDLADYRNPQAYPEGIEGVMIGGEWVYKKF